jgi:galactose mutarotase-like enzyme
MFETRLIEGPPRLVELRDQGAGSLAVVAPDRGGMLTRFRAGDAEVLYLDEATFSDPSKNVRGGVPVLFPSPGKLTGDAWAQAGKKGSLKQHGFARNLPWKILRTGSADAATVTLRLEASAETRRDYPWDIALDYTYALRGASLTIEQHIENRSDTAMPFGAGFHPYFQVRDAEKAGARITTAATRGFDNVQKREVAFTGFDLTRPEVDMHLHDHGSSSATLSWAGRSVTVTCSPEMTHWVVWTLAGRDFVCLEPWTCPGDALNTGDRLLWLGPGEARTLSTRIDAVGVNVST